MTFVAFSDRKRRRKQFAHEDHISGGHAQFAWREYCEAAFAYVLVQGVEREGIVGGKVVFLEYERDRPKLFETYTKTHKFREFPMPSVEDKGGKLGQLFRFLD